MQTGSNARIGRCFNHNSHNSLNPIEVFQKEYMEYQIDPVSYWERKSKNFTWLTPFNSVLTWNYPYASWFSGGTLNISSNCLDRHVYNGRKNKVALIWRGEDRQEKVYTYRRLMQEVMRFSNVLVKAGVKKGDRVCVFMPLVPELYISLLACTRVGAIHVVMPEGIGSQSLHSRLLDCSPVVVVTADFGIRNGKTVPYRGTVIDSIRNTDVSMVIVLSREKSSIDRYSDIEEDYYRLMQDAENFCPSESMDAEDPLFILYPDSDQTQVKGVVHSCAGYMVGVHNSFQTMFTCTTSDLYWCTADISSMTGHSYSLYGPLLAGATIFVTESGSDWPAPDNWWEIVDDFGVTIFFTTQGKVQDFIRVGNGCLQNCRLDTLRIIGSAGSPLDNESLSWYHQVIGRERCLVIDTWLIPETGTGVMASLKEPGSSSLIRLPMPGYSLDCVDKKGDTLLPGENGYLVIKEPWPSMMRSVCWNDLQYCKYWNCIPGNFFTGFMAEKSGDGSILMQGRVDEVRCL